MTQALASRVNVLQFEHDPYILLHDTAKAYPSTRQPLLWETMYTLGVPPAMISILRHAYEHTRSFFNAEGQQQTYRQKREVKQGCPLSQLMFCTRGFTDITAAISVGEIICVYGQH